MIRVVLVRKVLPYLNLPNVRKLSETAVGSDEGFTRSIHCKQEFKNIEINGEISRIPTGLVDNTNIGIGDQFIDLQMKLTYKHDLDLSALKQWLNRRAQERNRTKQIVMNDAMQHLGLDLAVARMVCRIGGRVQFTGNSKWFFSFAGIPAMLPDKYVGDLKIESIDFSGTNVVFEGFELISQLTDLRHLRLRRCVHVDDFCLSRVGRALNLELLDVSECPKLTSKGIATLTQLKKLRRLFISGNPLMEDKELVCLLLEDHLPQLYIQGVNYLGQLPTDSRHKVLALVAATEIPADTQERFEESNKTIQTPDDTFSQSERALA